VQACPPPHHCHPSSAARAAGEGAGPQQRSRARAGARSERGSFQQPIGNPRAGFATAREWVQQGPGRARRPDPSSAGGNGSGWESESRSSRSSLGASPWKSSGGRRGSAGSGSGWWRAGAPGAELSQDKHPSPGSSRVLRTGRWPPLRIGLDQLSITDQTAARSSRAAGEKR